MMTKKENAGSESEFQRGVMPPFKIGDWILYDAIGAGIYEVVDMGQTFFNVKCLRLFVGGRIWDKQQSCRGHVTNISRRRRQLIDYENLQVKLLKVA